MGDLPQRHNQWVCYFTRTGPLRPPTLEDKKQDKHTQTHTHTHTSTQSISSSPLFMSRLFTFIYSYVIWIDWDVHWVTPPPWMPVEFVKVSIGAFIKMNRLFIHCYRVGCGTQYIYIIIYIISINQDTSLGIIKLSTPNFLRTVENCIREGGSIRKWLVSIKGAESLWFGGFPEKKQD